MLHSTKIHDDRTSTKSYAYKYAGLYLPTGSAGTEWTMSPGGAHYSDAQKKMQIRLDCCSSFTNAVWTTGDWVDAPEFGSKCGANNGVQKRWVKCNGRDACLPCVRTLNRPVSIRVNVDGPPCCTPKEWNIKTTEVSCDADGTIYRVTSVTCPATDPCGCEGSNLNFFLGELPISTPSHRPLPRPLFPTQWCTPLSLTHAYLLCLSL